jgi:1-pyrroline-5-carboxylate dehydrogenase
MSFRLTYSTMFDPPAELHEHFDNAVEKVRGNLGQTYAHFINGGDVSGDTMIDDLSPINTDHVLGRFPVATSDHVDQAVSAARAAFPAWRAMPAKERNRILRRVGELIEERVYDISAAVALEVGKNRMEAIGEIQETADFFYCYCDDFEKQEGFDHTLPDDPLPDFASHNRSIMKPYGVWAVVAPFNFPFALAGGPAAAALVTGNTVVVKGARECRPACSITLLILMTPRDHCLSTMPMWPASRLPALTKLECRFVASLHRALIRDHVSRKWVARMPSSLPPMAILIAPRSASCARPSD